MSDNTTIGNGEARSSLTVFCAVALSTLLVVLDQTWPQPIQFAGIVIPNEFTATLGVVVSTFFWISLAHTVNCLLDKFVWHSASRRRLDVPIPKLLTQLAASVIWMTTAVILMALVYDIPVAGFLTTSGIIIAVIGFALRNLISDVFTGIALGLERPLKIGDWIEFDQGEPGRIVEINWRASRLVTADEISVVVPNSQLATAAFRNYSTPQKYWRDKFDIVLPYDVTYRQAERILLSAVAQVPDSANIPRKPDVLIGDYLERGTTWRLRYWVPDYSRLAVTRYEIKRNVLRNLYYAGIKVPHTQMDVFSPRWAAAKEDEEHEDINFLHGIALLSPLTREELEELGRNMRRHLCVAGQPVVHEGEEGDSLFVVKEGTLEASSTNENGFNTIVGRLNPGNFFGEMSLLTGAPRSANVAPSVDSIVFEITRADLEPLMQKRPDMAAQLSEVLAERQMRNIRLLDGKEVGDPSETQVSLSQQFLSGIQKFFGLGQGGRADSRQPAGSD